MCNCNTVARDAITIAIWSGLRPDTPPTPHGPRKNSAYRSPFPNSSNRKSRGPAPLALTSSGTVSGTRNFFAGREALAGCRGAALTRWQL
ncbi:hypothetical protein BIQ78_25035 [Escherichia coli]|nr:hypothetical protein BIQ78_25035 [Escherichia coli]